MPDNDPPAAAVYPVAHPPVMEAWPAGTRRRALRHALRYRAEARRAWAAYSAQAWEHAPLHGRIATLTRLLAAAGIDPAISPAPPPAPPAGSPPRPTPCACSTARASPTPAPAALRGCARPGGPWRGGGGVGKRRENYD